MANFVSVQMAHYMPMKEMSRSRVRTGYEQVIAHRSGLPFAYTAEEDGKVVEIQEDIGVVSIQYKKKGLFVLEYGASYTKNGGGGFYVPQNVVLNQLKAGSRFKKGDVLLYNSDYFTDDPYSKQVDLSLGLYANIALMEGPNTIEDGSVITKSLSNRMSSTPVRERSITITKDTIIHKVATVGTKVRSIDPLMVFDESTLTNTSTMDKEVLDVISELNKSIPKAKYSGVVVKMEAYYRAEHKDMNKSVKALVRSINRTDKAKAKYSASADNSDNYIEPKPLVGDKLDGVILDEDMVVIKFFIQQELDMDSGDKLVFGGALKSVVSTVLEKDIEVEDGSIKVDAIMGASSFFDRMVLSTAYIGILERVIEDVETGFLDSYFN